MKEYIEREAACAYKPPEKKARRYITYNLDDAFEDGYDEHIKQVEAIPAADVVEVRHGEWIMIDGMPHCNKCGLLPEHPTRYCPNCGAKMTEDRHEQKE